MVKRIQCRVVRSELLNRYAAGKPVSTRQAGTCCDKGPVAAILAKRADGIAADASGSADNSRKHDITGNSFPDKHFYRHYLDKAIRHGLILDFLA